MKNLVQYLNEGILPQNLETWIQKSATSEQKNSAKQVETWLTGLKTPIVGGTVVGSLPKTTLILDLRKDEGEITIDYTGEIIFLGFDCANYEEFKSVFKMRYK